VQILADGTLIWGHRYKGDIALHSMNLRLGCFCFTGLKCSRMYMTIEQVVDHTSLSLHCGTFNGRTSLHSLANLRKRSYLDFFCCTLLNNNQLACKDRFLDKLQGSFKLPMFRRLHWVSFVYIPMGFDSFAIPAID
jgi:hypothetical protein